MGHFHQMAAVSAGELELMRGAQEAAMLDRVDITRRVLIDDSFGGSKDGTPVTIAEDVPARITQAQVQTMYGQADRALALEKWIIRLPYGTNLQDEDYVVWGDTTIQVEDVKARGLATTVRRAARL